tara:strand:+ start:499 stop:774 length:276 start_codon:yes stop_codon:yes gene_type:complete
MKRFNREFLIYTEDGESIWHWDLNQTDKVIDDFFEHKNDPTFRIEIQDWYGEDFDYVEIYPEDEGIKDFPKYVQKSIYKVLDQIGVNNEST